MKPTWVIFDIGGVIFNFKTAIEDVASHLGIEKKILLDRILSHMDDGELGKITFQEVWLKIFEEFKLTHEPDAVIDIWHDVNRWSKDTTLLIQQLHAAGYKLGALTNNWKGITKKYFGGLEIFPLFNMVIDSSEEAMRKPDLALFKLVEARIDAHGEDIFFIDDTINNILAAKQMQWQTYHYSLGEDEGRTSNDIIRQILI